MIQSSSNQWGFFMAKENETADEDEGLIEIDLSPKDEEALITTFIRKNFTKESGTVFCDTLISTDNLKQAAFSAMLNEVITEVLSDQVAREMIAASKEACNVNVES